MNERELHQLLDLVRLGALPPDRAVARLKHLPFEDLGFAKVDHHRSLRQGYAEVVFGKGKTPEQVAEIVKSMLRQKGSRQNILITRADAATFKAVRRLSFSEERREISCALRRNHHREQPRNYRQGADFRCLCGNQRHPRGRGSSTDRTYDGQSLRAIV